MARPGLLLYFDVLPALDKLPHAAVGELLLAALRYAQDGVEPTFADSSLEFAWAFLRPSVDRDGATYETKRLKGEWLAYCKQCKRDNAQPLDFNTWCERVDNGTLHTVDVSLQTPTAPKPTPSTSTTTSPSPNNIKGADKPPKRQRFVPPDVEEVRAYCLERRNGIDPAYFVDYYTARGWKYNGGQAMKDWKSAIRTWEKRNKQEGGKADELPFL